MRTVNLRRTDNTMEKDTKGVMRIRKSRQTTQWPKDTKGVMRIRKSKKNRQHNGQKIPKG